MWVRWVLAGDVVGFLEGAGAHCLDLIRGGVHFYAVFAPVPLQVFFVGLVVLDPLTVVLVGLARPEGVWPASGVVVLDVLANWCVNWPQVKEDPAVLPYPVGLLPITLFGLFVAASSAPLLRVMARARIGGAPAGEAGG